MKLVFFRILYVFFIVFLGISFFLGNNIVQTNILQAILPKNQSTELILNLTNKNAARVSIIIEADNENELSEKVESFKLELNEANIAFQKINYDEILSMYKKNPIAFLSFSLREKLLEGKYSLIRDGTKQKLYDPFYSSMLFVPLNQDPFMILNDFLLNLGSGDDVDFIKNEGKYYGILNYVFSENIALSPNLLNKEVEKLIKLKRDWIHFSGSPIHSYFISKSAQKQTNIISCFAIVFVLVILWFYFRSCIPVFWTIASVTIAFGVGFLFTSYIFKEIHVLTFVFSTTLIGICVDYSLHYFVELSKNSFSENILNKIIKSLSSGLFTTVGAFSVLFFSQIPLLQQVAVYTSAGLIAVYLFVILFYPIFLKKEYNKNLFPKFNFFLPKQFAAIVTIISILLISFGFSNIKLNDEITTIYKPSGELLKAEQLHAKLVNNSNTVLLISSDSELEFQKHIEKEEFLIDKIRLYNPEFEFEALSKYLPSKKMQQDNLELVSELYKAELDNYADFLSKDTKDTLRSNVKRNGIVTYDSANNSLLNSFILDKNKTFIILNNISDISYLASEKNVEIIDIKSDLSQIIASASQKCYNLILPVFILMFSILAIAFKPKKALLLIIPSVLGALMSIAIPALFGIQINFFHIISLFLVIGFGIDYSVFRYASSVWARDAIALSSMTTIFSFMLLGFVDFKLISSLGMVVAIGLVFSYLFSLIFISRNADEKVV